MQFNGSMKFLTPIYTYGLLKHKQFPSSFIKFHPSNGSLKVIYLMCSTIIASHNHFQSLFPMESRNNVYTVNLNTSNSLYFPTTNTYAKKQIRRNRKFAINRPIAITNQDTQVLQCQESNVSMHFDNCSSISTKRVK